MQLYLFIALAVLSWGLVSVLEKTIIGEVKPWAFVFWRWAGLGICLILVMSSSGKLREMVAVPSWKYILIAMATGVISWLIAQFFFFKALELEEVSIVVPFIATFPLVTVVAAYFLLREPLSWPKLFGTIFIVAGCMLLYFDVSKRG